MDDDMIRYCLGAPEFTDDVALTDDFGYMSLVVEKHGSAASIGGGEEWLSRFDRWWARMAQPLRSVVGKNGSAGSIGGGQDWLSRFDRWRARKA